MRHGASHSPSCGKISVDIVSIDREHRDLVAMIEAIFQDLRAGKSRDHCLGALDALIAKVTEHFAHEERIMRNIGLPDVDRHRQIHAALLDEMRQFRKEADGPLTPEAIDTTERFLDYWLLRHITSEDLKIGEHINRR